MKIQLVLLASGFGRRFGSNKLTALLHGRPLYTYGMESLCRAAQAFLPSSGIDCSVTVVTAHREIAAACRAQGTPCLWNEQAREGMAASLRCAVENGGDAAAWAFFPADQPLLRAKTIAAFLCGFLASGADVGCMHNGQRRCSPAIFRRIYQERLLQLHGDTGGRQFLRQENVWVYRPERREELFDMDTESDFIFLNNSLEE
ncbi:nucleotidyltransferase family protein [Megasphaera sp.]|uniref:nucleotidyltransferase family protein n=1 Tax=Megasphaera sp. TaxID=2023260 RepID=UPI0025F3D015|nr:nucleotidyltransferase family protein [uncultured Megasphaera sp.]